MCACEWVQVPRCRAGRGRGQLSIIQHASTGNSYRTHTHVYVCRGTWRCGIRTLSGGARTKTHDTTASSMPYCRNVPFAIHIYRRDSTRQQLVSKQVKRGCIERITLITSNALTSICRLVVTNELKTSKFLASKQLVIQSPAIPSTTLLLISAHNWLTFG